MGQDSITIDTGGVAGVINGGAGVDTITLLTGAQAATIAGGGLGDTIAIASGGINGTVIYGDAYGFAGGAARYRRYCDVQTRSVALLFSSTLLLRFMALVEMTPSSSWAPLPLRGAMLS